MAVNSVDARIDEVTLYAAGARVRRVTTVEHGATRVRIAGLPLAVIDDTLRVEVQGPAVATALVAGRDAPPTATAASEVPAALRSADRAARLATDDVERIEAALTALADAPVVEADASDEPPATWESVLAARQALIATRGQRERALREALATATQLQREAQRAFAAAADRDRRASGARAPKLHELRKYVDVELELEPTATASGPVTITLEYLVAAARWTPSYVARLDGARTHMEIRATVAQATGEDWTGVALRLSTAEPARFAALPELHAQRIGRRQAEPGKAGFRAPPVGAGGLYADYDRARPARPAHPVRPERPFGGSVGGDLDDAKPMQPTPRQAPKPEAWDDDDASLDQAPSNAPLGGKTMPAAPMASTPMAKRASPAKSRSVQGPAPRDTSVMTGAGGGGGSRNDAFALAPAAASADQAAPPAGPAPARLDYEALRMAPLSSPARGTLVAARVDRDDGDAEVDAALGRVQRLPLPPGCHASWAHSYDYAYAADGAVDVAADGGWHSIAVTALPTTATLRHVTTPREQPDVFRMATLTNPFPGPLLPGPIDVYDAGRFLLTSTVEQTSPGATVEVGLGVDAAVKVARNTEYREEATGMLRGGLRLHHGITIDIENVSPRAIDLEVRERIPVARENDDDVEVTLGRVEPAWERFTPDPATPQDRQLRGGHRWKLAIPPAQNRTLRASYEVKIAAKYELVGGNRRES